MSINHRDTEDRTVKRRGHIMAGCNSILAALVALTLCHFSQGTFVKQGELFEVAESDIPNAWRKLFIQADNIFENGYIAGFTAFFHNTAPIRLQVWERKNESLPNTYTLRSERRVIPEGTGLQTVSFDPSEFLYTLPGDRYGYFNEDKNATIGYRVVEKDDPAAVEWSSIRDSWPQVNDSWKFDKLKLGYQFAIELSVYIEVDDCVNVTCLNGGVCVDGFDNYTCHCKNNYIGVDCEKSATEDQCATLPCQNSGACIDMMNDYFCSCPPQYTGRNCQIATICPNITEPENSVLTVGSLNNNLPGSTVEFSCDSGYHLNGYTRLTCLTTGSWDADVPTCNVNVCPNVTAPEFSTARDEDRNITAEAGEDIVDNSVGDTIVFACDTGYHTVGSDVITCTKDGHWDYPPIAMKCEENRCPDLTVPNNAQISTGTGSGNIVGHKVLFECDSDFTLLGSPELICNTSGLWDKPAPYCQEIKCPAIVLPVQASVSAGSLTERSKGDSITFTCGNGFVLHGAATITCKENGQWNSNAPICEVISCPTLKVPDNGMVASSPLSTIVGTIVVFECDAGFNLLGAQSIRCQSNGAWTNNVPFCSEIAAITCPDLKLPLNANLTNGTLTNNTVNSSVEVECIDRYTIMGSSVLTCMSDGAWDTHLPFCQKVEDVTCPDVIQPLNSELTAGSLTENKINSTVKIGCVDGHTLVGSSVLTCMSNGAWDANVPYCQRIEGVTCPDVILPINSKVTTGAVNGNQINSTVEMECLDGYSLIGSTVLTCMSNGAWDINVPYCQKVKDVTCPDVIQPMNSELTAGSLTGNKINSTVEIKCLDGFTLMGSSVLTCMSHGAWDANVPFCRKVEDVTCPDVIQPMNSELTAGSLTGNKINSTVGIKCLDGFTLMGSSVLTCMSKGAWDANVPFCQQVEDVACPDVIQPMNSELTAGSLTGNKINSTVGIKCLDGFTLMGSSILTCMPDGAWDQNVPFCSKIQCPVVIQPANGAASGNDRDKDSRVTFTCSSDHVLKGSDTITCQANGQWSGNVPFCDQKPTGDNGTDATTVTSTVVTATNPVSTLPTTTEPEVTTEKDNKGGNGVTCPPQTAAQTAEQNDLYLFIILILVGVIVLLVLIGFFMLIYLCRRSYTVSKYYAYNPYLTNNKMVDPERQSGGTDARNGQQQGSPRSPTASIGGEKNNGFKFETNENAM
ncbi:unnamed protein product [Owenia fusiformis]|uniref:Uncharacterized protein n=1 Tax=Owenia fusiformis TaxID=6347 RepID=A0A8S4PAC3_OWEFU|nr:unnamed protein product [Owenia fusiformis]